MTTPNPRPRCWAALTAPTFHGPFPTEAEALADARRQGQTRQIRLGQLMQTPASAYLDTDPLIRQLQNEAGYWSSGRSGLWLTDVPLDARLSRALDDWASEHDQQPQFFRAEDTRVVTL